MWCSEAQCRGQGFYFCFFVFLAFTNSQHVEWIRRRDNLKQSITIINQILCSFLEDLFLGFFYLRHGFCFWIGMFSKHDCKHLKLMIEAFFFPAIFFPISNQCFHTEIGQWMSLLNFHILLRLTYCIWNFWLEIFEDQRYVDDFQ